MYPWRRRANVLYYMLHRGKTIHYKLYIISNFTRFSRGRDYGDKMNAGNGYGEPVCDLKSLTTPSRRICGEYVDGTKQAFPTQVFSTTCCIEVKLVCKMLNSLGVNI